MYFSHSDTLLSIARIYFIALLLFKTLLSHHSPCVQSVYLLSLFALRSVFVYSVFYPDLSKGSLHMCLCSVWSGSCHLSGAPDSYGAPRGVGQLQVPSREWSTAHPSEVEERQQPSFTRSGQGREDMKADLNNKIIPIVSLSLLFLSSQAM